MSRVGFKTFFVIVALGHLFAAADGWALLGDCGQPLSTGAKPAAADSLAILREAVGHETACDGQLCVCDVDGNGNVQAADALTALRASVGGLVTLACECEASTTTTTLPPLQKPAAPAAFTGVAVSSSQVDLQWSDNSDNEDAFRMERRVGEGSYAFLLTLPAGSESHSDQTVTAGTTYKYRIRARNAAGNSAWSSELTVTTPSVPTTPAPPASLTALAISSQRIELSWVDKSDDETGFRLERKAGASGVYEQKTSLAAGATVYSDTSVVAGTTYYYRVRAFNAVGDSAYSNEAWATAPAASCPSITPLANLRQNCSTRAYGYVWQNSVAEAYVTDGTVIAVGQTDGTNTLYFGGTVKSSTTFGLLYIGTSASNLLPLLEVGSGGSISSTGYSLNLTLKLDGDTYLFNNAVFDSSWTRNSVNLRSRDADGLLEETRKVFEALH